MNKTSLKERLINYIAKVGKPIASGELQRIVAEKTSYSPSNVSRRLRELETEGRVKVEYRKGHAWYSMVQGLTTDQMVKKDLEWFDSLSNTPKI